MTETAAPTTPAAGRSPYLAMALAWLIPGLGHYYLGRRRTAVAFAVIVVLTFLAGLSFQGRLYSIEQGQPLTVLATFAVWGAGLLNIAARLFSENPGGTILVGDLRVRLRLSADRRADEPAAGPGRVGPREGAQAMTTPMTMTMPMVAQAMAAVIPTDHFLIMTLYALLVSAFFAVLWRDDRRERWKLFGILVAALVGGGLAVAWLMYPFPR